MTEIVAGELKFNETTKRARGGTELMAERIHRDVDEGLLKRSQIIFSRVREIRDDLKVFLYCHDLVGDPENEHLKDPELRKRFKKIIFVSEWQQQQFQNYYGIQPSECHVMLNAIEPIQIQSKPFDGKVKIIYHTTPHRGLDILANVFDFLYQNVTKSIELDVYSSFGVYGWEERDLPYQKLFEFIKNHPGMNYHGAVSNEEVREALKTTHIFGYPSIWPETSCIAAIEAASAGNIIVYPNFAALPETTAKLSVMYPFDENKNVHANTFANKLLEAIRLVGNQDKRYIDMVSFQKTYCDRTYDWNKRIREWDNFLRPIVL